MENKTASDEIVEYAKSLGPLGKRHEYALRIATVGYDTRDAIKIASALELDVEKLQEEDKAMNFIISRVSSDMTPPIDGATRFEYTYQGTRTENYKFLETRVGWTINIESLDELIALMKQVGEKLIIGPWYADGRKTEITIYDGYVE